MAVVPDDNEDDDLGRNSEEEDPQPPRSQESDYLNYLSNIHIMTQIYQVTAFLETLELQESAKLKGHFALFNCLVLGHNKYKGVQRVYCNPFPSKMFTGSKSFYCALVSTLETCDGPENGNNLYYTHYCNYCHYSNLFAL